MTNVLKFSIETANSKVVKTVSESLSNFFDDDRISFECNYEKTNNGIIFFGIYGTDQDELYNADIKTLNALTEYVNMFDTSSDNKAFEINSCIQKASFKEFQERTNEDEYESTEESMVIIDEIIDETWFDDDEEIAEEDDDSDFGSVIVDPLLIAKLENEDIGAINKTVFDAM